MCPVTRQPDLSHVEIEYEPDRGASRRKSLKLYLWGFRDRAVFAEALAAEIAGEVMATARPRRVTVDADAAAPRRHRGAGRRRATRRGLSGGRARRRAVRWRVERVPFDLPARLRARRRVHRVDDDRRPGAPTPRRCWRGARVRRRRRRRRGLPRADAVGLLDRGPAAAGRAARRGRGGAGHDRRRLGRPAAGARRRRAAAPPRPDLQLRGRRPPRPGARRRAEVLPADLPRVLRAPPARARRRRSAATIRGRRRRRAVRARPAVRRRRRRPASWCTSRSARTCGCRSRRAPRRRWPARRCCSTSPAARSPSAAPRTASCCAARASSRCLAAYVYAAAGEGESTHRPLLGRPDDDLRERRRCSPRPSASRTATARAVADVDLDLLRQERTADGHVRRQPARPRRARRRVPRGPLHARPADRRPRPAARASSASRSCPSDASRLEQDCYEAYNIQVAGPAAAAARRSATRRSSSASPAGSTRPTR